MSPLRIVLLIFLVLFLLGALGPIFVGTPAFYGGGPYLGGGLGLIVVVLVVLLLLGKL